MFLTKWNICFAVFVVFGLSCTSFRFPYIFVQFDIDHMHKRQNMFSTFFKDDIEIKGTKNIKKQRQTKTIKNQKQEGTKSNKHKTNQEET